MVSEPAAFVFLPFVKIGVAVWLWESADIIGLKMPDGVDSLCMWKFGGSLSSFWVLDFFLECGSGVDFNVLEAIGWSFEIFFVLISDELHADGAEVEFFVVIGNRLRISRLLIGLMDAWHGIIILLVGFLG